MYSSSTPSKSEAVRKNNKEKITLIIEEDTIYELDEDCLNSHCKEAGLPSCAKIIPEQSPDVPAKS